MSTICKIGVGGCMSVYDARGLYLTRKLSVLAGAQCFLENGSLTEGWCFVLVLINGTRVPQFASGHALGSGDVGRARAGW